MWSIARYFVKCIRLCVRDSLGKGERYTLLWQKESVDLLGFHALMNSHAVLPFITWPWCLARLQNIPSHTMACQNISVKPLLKSISRRSPDLPWPLCALWYTVYVWFTVHGCYDFCFLSGLSECTLDEMTYDSLIPLQLLQNYVRLVRWLTFCSRVFSMSEFLFKSLDKECWEKQGLIIPWDQNNILWAFSTSLAPWGNRYYLCFKML